MSPFKEPQPRKNSAAEDAKRIIGGNWPPYAREGGEANWISDKPLTEEWPPEPSEDAKERLAEWANTPIMVLPDHTGFELRKTALEAALGLGLEPNHHAALFWDNLQTFESYLRDGTRPS